MEHEVPPGWAQIGSWLLALGVWLLALGSWLVALHFPDTNHTTVPQRKSGTKEASLNPLPIGFNDNNVKTGVFELARNLEASLADTIGM
jgi:hypothetical protein